MDLNKAMVELYKQRSAANRRKTLPAKRGKNDDIDGNEILNSPLSNRNADQSKKRPKVQDIIEANEYKPKATFEHLHGCESAREHVLEIVKRFQRFIDGKSKKSDWPTLICGSHGLGKTSIVEAVANYATLKLIPIFLKTIVDQTRNEFKVTLNELLSECLSNQPAIVLVDDLDQIRDKEELRILLQSVIRRLLGDQSKLLIFCTTSSIVDDTSGIDFALTVHLKRPVSEARYKILESLRESNKNLANLSDVNLRSLAINTPSFTPLDLRKMLDIAETKSDGMPTIAHCDMAVDVVKKSFKRGTHLIGEKPSVTWKDIGGLSEVRHAFIDILKQIKKGDINCKFAGVALYGPPGCGKTMVAQAMANEAGLNFISIKPAELVDKFLGETEKNIRRVFSEAQEHEPCMIYFDEFDGLCGTRGNRDNITGAIQTLLSEMDGFVGRGKSIIMASTNRLEDIDPAMKRPGRLSKHIYVGPPTEKARRDILAVITSRPSVLLDEKVNLDLWASKTKNFTGADLDFLVAEAESRATSELDSNGEIILQSTDQEHIRICQHHLEYALNRIRTTNKELGKKTVNVE